MKIDGWYRLRKTRDELLNLTDKFMISDFPIDTKLRTRYKEYREYLRALPKMYNEDNIKTYKVKTFEEYLEWKRSGEY